MIRALALTSLLVGCMADDPDLATDETEQALNGDTWITADDNGYGAGTGALANGIAISPVTHTIVVVGARGEADGSATWITRESANGATTFTLNSIFRLAVGRNAYAYNVTVDSAGYFYEVGMAFDANQSGHWIVRRSVNDGATWATVFDEAGHDVKDIPSGISVDAAGNVFISGTTWLFGTATARILRGPNHGAAGGWTEVFTHQGYGADNNFYGTCTSKYGTQNATYAVGWETVNPAAETEGMLYYTLDGGTTWIWKYDFFASWAKNEGLNCAAGPGNRTMVVSTSFQSSPQLESEWLADVSDVATGTAYTYDSVGTLGTTTEAAYGALYVAGPAQRYYAFGAWRDNTTGGVHWHARFAANAQYSAWTNSDDYVYPGGSTGKALNGAYDTTRGLYVVGWAYDGNNRIHGVVRHRQ